ncbi:MAG: MarR family transcriptional regulator [Betaproteobacteria bacterium]
MALDDAYLRASRALGLSAQQAELLCAALRPAGIGDMARVLRCDRSNVTRLVDRASKRGLMRRRPDEADGRATVIELTAKGRRLAERFIALLEAQTQDLVARWSATRQRAMIQVLNEVADALDSHRPEPAMLCTEKSAT